MANNARDLASERPKTVARLVPNTFITGKVKPNTLYILYGTVRECGVGPKPVLISDSKIPEGEGDSGSTQATADMDPYPLQ